MVYAILSPGEVAAAGATFPVVCTVLTGLRFYVRGKRDPKWALDDWLVIPALVLTIGMGVATLVGVATKSEALLTSKTKKGAESYSAITLILWLSEMFQALALGCIKLSFMFFYRRIFNVKGHTRQFNLVSIAFIVTLTAWSLGFFAAFLAACPGHPSAFWSSGDARIRYCWKTKEFLFAFCFTDFLTDLMVLILPIPYTCRLQMALKRKVAVIGIFSLGAITVAASITRAVLYVGFLDSETTGASYDVDMLDSNGIYWILIETGLGLCAVNLPVIYGHFSRMDRGNPFQRLYGLLSLRSKDRSQDTQSPYGSAGPWKRMMRSNDTAASDHSVEKRNHTQRERFEAGV